MFLLEILKNISWVTKLLTIINSLKKVMEPTWFQVIYNFVLKDEIIFKFFPQI